MAETYDIDIKINVDTSELEDATSSLQDLESTGEEISEGLDSASESATNAGESFQEAGDKASTAGDQMEGMGDQAQTGASNVEDAASNTSSSMDGIAQAAVGVGAAMGLMGMVDTAGNIEASWDRLSITFGGVTDGMRSSINDAASATGRSGSSIRGYFNSMGIAGIKNTDLLNQSFQALSGKAFQTGVDVNQLGNLVQKMALSGNAGARQLTALGISTDQLGKVMGVAGSEASKAFKNLSQEERLRVLTQAMGDGSAANEAYKNSWEGVKEQAGNAMAGLMGAVGSTILPIVVPALQSLTQIIGDVKNTFTSLPAPVQGVIGVIGGLVLGFTAIGGAMAIIGPVVTGIIGGFGTLTGIITALTTAESASAAISGVLAAVMGTEAAGATMAGGAFGFLGAMELTALWPILAIIGAVALLVAGFEALGEWLGWWDSFGGMIDAAKSAVIRLWDAFINNEAVQTAISLVQSYIDFVIGIYSYLWGVISGVLSQIGEAIMSVFGEEGSNPDAIGAIIEAFTILYDTASSVIGAILNFFQPIITGIQTIAQTIQAMFTGQIGVLDGLMMIGQTLLAMYMGFWQNLANLFMQGLQTVWNMVVTGVQSIWNGFLNLLSYLSTLPGRVWSFLLSVVTRVAQWEANLVNKARSTATSFVNSVINGLTSLPGRVASSLASVITAVVNWGKNMVAKAQQVAGDVKNALINAVNPLNNSGGFSGNFSGNFSAGFNSGSTLNGALANSISNNTVGGGVVNNFSINGIVEESASEYIVKAVNENIRKQNLIRGV